MALGEEADQKAGILDRLGALGFEEAALLRLKDKIEEMAVTGRMKPAELREELFLDLESYTSVRGFRSAAQSLHAEVRGLRDEKQALDEENRNLRQAIEGLREISDQAMLNIQKREGQIIASMNKLFSEASKALDQSLSGASELQSDIQSTRQKIRKELGTVVSEAVDYGREMARMDRVVSEREELVRLFSMLGDVSSVPKGAAVKTPLVVLGKLRQWVEKNHGLINEKKLLSCIEEIVGLLTLEAT